MSEKIAAYISSQKKPGNEDLKAFAKAVHDLATANPDKKLVDIEWFDQDGTDFRDNKIKIVFYYEPIDK